MPRQNLRSAANRFIASRLSRETLISVPRTLPANIKKYNENFYTVNNVYFNNGGYLYFGDSDYVEYLETAYEIDQNENFWDIELTNIKTVHKKVTETNPKNIKKLFLPFVEIFIMLIRTIMFAFNCKKEV